MATAPAIPVPRPARPGRTYASTQILGGLVPDDSLKPPGLDHTRAQGDPTVTTTGPAGVIVVQPVPQPRRRKRPRLGTRIIAFQTNTVAPASLTHTRAQGDPAVSSITQVSPASLTHTRDVGTPTVSPQALPASLDHARAQGDITVTAGFQVSPASLTHTRTVGDPVVSPQVLPAALDHTRAQGSPAVTVQVEPVPTVHRVAQPALAGRRTATTQIVGGLTPTETTNPSPPGLDHTRELGNPQVIGQPGVIPDLIVAGAAKGTIRAVPKRRPQPKYLPSTDLFVYAEQEGAAPSGLEHTRAQGTPTVHPQVQPAGQAHTRALGAPTVGQAAVRQLGNPVVTVQWIARPTGLEHARLQGSATVTGRTVTLTALEHARAQGTPQLSARALPSGLSHTRTIGAPSVNPRTASPASITHTRNIDAPTVTLVKITRPASLDHARTIGTPTTIGHMTAGPPSLTRTRQQGTPTLSGRATPASLTRTRNLGSPAVNVRTLVPLAISRA